MEISISKPLFEHNYSIKVTAVEMPCNARNATSSKFLLVSAGDKEVCGFCTKNGEEEQFVRTHTLRDSETGRIQCPVLRKHRCEACGATGDNAHTRSHCPRIRMQEGRVQSIALSVKTTQRKSSGMKRK